MEGKKMGLNGLMNKISMGLKDAALQQGFEVICKRLAKLEKENKISEEIIIGEQQEINEQRRKIDDLESQIKGFENDFDYQNKVIDKYKEDLKKLRVAYIQAQVANVISGTDFESILKNILSGEFEK